MPWRHLVTDLVFYVNLSCEVKHSLEGKMFGSMKFSTHEGQPRLFVSPLALESWKSLPTNSHVIGDVQQWSAIVCSASEQLG